MMGPEQSSLRKKRKEEEKKRKERDSKASKDSSKTQQKDSKSGANVPATATSLSSSQPTKGEVISIAGRDFQKESMAAKASGKGKAIDVWHAPNHAVAANNRT